MQSLVATLGFHTFPPGLGKGNWALDFLWSSLSVYGQH